MHKNTSEQSNSETATPDRTSDTNRNSGILDIERENRLSRIISLYSKGLTQAEIARN